MRKGILLLSAIALFSFSESFAQESGKKKTKKATTTKVAATKKVETPKIEGAAIQFESEVIDYGTIPHNADGKREFVFTNTGNQPLIISNAQGSCGCTVPSKPEKPIMPGEKGVIGVKYATDRVGQFTKTITLTLNTAEGSKLLTIKGNVLPDAAPATTPAVPKS